MTFVFSRRSIPAPAGCLLVNVQMCRYLYSCSSAKLMLTGLQFSDDESEGSGEEETDAGDKMMFCANLHMMICCMKAMLARQSMNNKQQCLNASGSSALAHHSMAQHSMAQHGRQGSTV